MREYNLVRGNLKEILHPVKQVVENKTAGYSPRVPFGLIWGFHVYIQLRLKLSITASETDTAAGRYLRILNDCATAVEICARTNDAELLEVQSDKLHVFMEAQSASIEAQKKLFEFCTALADRIENKIIPKDPEAWDAFAMAADHGRSVIVNLDWDSSQSIVSLGVPANSPAKQLYRIPCVPHGNLIFNSNWQKSNNEDLEPIWGSVNLLGQNGKSAAYYNRETFEKFGSLIEESSKRHQTEVPDFVKFADAAGFQREYATGTLAGPQRIQGYFIRADLDGFTAKVKAAFKAGDSAIRALIIEFCNTMESVPNYSLILTKKNMAMSQLPWAGDCANMIVFPANFGKYEDSRGVLPFNASLLWHESAGQQGRKWAVGVAGGGDDEGNGVMVVAPISADGRIFRVAAGWAVGRSLDAQEDEGMKAEMTSIPEHDWDELEECLQEAFKGLNLYRKATLSAMRNASQKLDRDLRKNEPASVSTFGIVTSEPRPHYDRI